jgi:hypothetical protein
MSIPTAQMTAEELKTLIRDAVKEALLEILHDSDAGLELRSEFRSRLCASQACVKRGGKLISWDDMRRCLDSK